MSISVKLSVRELVEFILRGGSIDNRYGGMERANEGARIHRQLQKDAGENYRAEVSLSHTTELGGVSFLVEGRADGIFYENGQTAIDEIKTTGAPLSQITEDYNRLHWAQAQCYAYFYALQNDLSSMAIRLTYYHVSDDEEDEEIGQIKRFTRFFSLSDLNRFYEDLLAQYLKWAQFQAEWKLLRDTTAKALTFPFPAYRPGQRSLSIVTYRAIRDGQIAFCQAPTGIGKTISTLFPTVKAIGEGLTEKIFYLTAKTITRQAAEDAFANLRQQGLRLKTITLTAKDKICFQEERNCNPVDCPYADGHFDRVNDVIFEMLQKEDTITREIVELYAEKYRVCPFELSLDLSNWCDSVICDYNYLFDPIMYLKRYFSDQGPYTFLVDEAHNLVDRAREMYSSQLEKSAYLDLKRRCSKENPKDRSLSRSLTKVNTAMIALRKQCQSPENEDRRDMEQTEPLEEFNKTLHRLSSTCEKWLATQGRSPLHPDVLQLYFDVLHYLKISELYDDHYLTAVHLTANQVTVRQCCLDPSQLLRTAMEHGQATVLFSATLTPQDYFAQVLGGDEESVKLALPSPFSPENLCLLVDTSISTRYKDREESYLPIAQRIAAAISRKPGNYMVYFPSYQYMTAVHEQFLELCPETEILLQQSNMTEPEREEFLRRFDEANEKTLVGFCVLGGIYSEGIDLKGDRLIGTIIVGVGLPQINPEQNRIRAYYDRTSGDGFSFAYQYPGMNKILQAAGRVIRCETDRGMVLLLDDRFRTGFYRRLFPAHWRHAQFLRTEEEITRALDTFWSADSPKG